LPSIVLDRHGLRSFPWKFVPFFTIFGSIRHNFSYGLYGFFNHRILHT